MQCVVLAGGLSTRLRPLTENVPKALVPVGGTPFLHYQLNWLSRHGIDEVVFSIGYKGQMIRDYVKDGAAWGLKVCFVDEGEKLKGTAGALRLALEEDVLDEFFFVLYGDSFLPIDFLDVWKTFKTGSRPALMTVFRNEGKWDTSNVLFKDGQVVLYDKQRRDPRSKEMDFIDYGLSILGRKTIEDLVPAGKSSDLAELYHHLSVQGLLGGFEARHRFFEIGSPAGLEDFRLWVEKNHGL